jgi:hypothetical protein
MRYFLTILGIVAIAAPAMAVETFVLDPAVLVDQVGPSQRTGTVVYDNTTTLIGGYSSTNLAFIWGDDTTLTAGGTLEDFTATIYNSSSSAGPLLTATLLFGFYDSSANYLGGFQGSVSWTSGLSPGYYSALSWTGLSGLSTPIVLPAGTTVYQTVTAMTGTATRLGIIAAYPPTVGSSAAGFYQNGTWTTTYGVYYKIGVIPEPASLVLMSLAGLLLARRR